MTKEEALTTLNLIKCNADLDMKRIRLACNIAMDAIKKQIPQKAIVEREDFPEINSFLKTYICPSCKKWLVTEDRVGFDGHPNKYCDCGQAIDYQL